MLGSLPRESEGSGVGWDTLIRGTLMPVAMLLNPAEELMLCELMAFYDVFHHGHKRSLREIFYILGLPEKRMQIMREALLQINRALAFELLTAAWLSRLDSVRASANALADAQGHPYGFAPRGMPDVQADYKYFRVIAEVSTLQKSNKSSYIENLKSALKHLKRQAPPCYCLHITNWDPSKEVQDEELEELLNALKPGQSLIRLNIVQVVNDLLNSFLTHPKTLDMPQEAMQTLLGKIHEATSQSLELGRMVREFLKERGEEAELEAPGPAPHTPSGGFGGPTP